MSAALPYRISRDVVFWVGLSLYLVQSAMESVGWELPLTRGYVNDFVCVPIWLPVVVAVQTTLRLRPSAGPPTTTEAGITVGVWAFVFEVWFPRTALLSAYTTSDRWDVVAYSAGAIIANIIWRRGDQGDVTAVPENTGHRRTRDSSGLQNDTGRPIASAGGRAIMPG